MNDPRWRILRALNQLENTGCPISSKYLSYVLDAGYKEIHVACQSAKFDGWIWYDRCGYRLTSEGREELKSVRIGELIDPEEERRWRKEVLTGMDSKGGETSINGGVLPGRESSHSRGDQDEWVDIRRRLARIGISPEDIRDGLVALCGKCGQWIKKGDDCCTGKSVNHEFK